jgi:SAM-dependent methyltransferase
VPEGFPTPPESLAARVGGPPEEFYELGRHAREWLLAALPDGWSFPGRKILDFGCGAGRALAHFADEAADAEFWGCDIHKPSIDWAARNLSPPFHFLHNDALPPLDLPDDSFDLIYGISVFTHLTDSWAPWLLEMRRLLKDGGLGVFSFLGEGMIEHAVGRAWDEDRVGMIAVAIGKPWDVGGPDVLHSEWWLRAHWGRAFEIVQLQPWEYPESRSGHGFLVVRKDDRTPPSREELERPEAGEQRELWALQFQVELLMAELAERPHPAVADDEHEPAPMRARNAQLQDDLDQATAALARAEAANAKLPELEDYLRVTVDRLEIIRGSTSWRLTQPLRALTAAGRRLRARG